MYNLTLPFNTSDSWLTVGDGIRTDANWLRGKGVDVMASDISIDLLAETKNKGHIDKFQQKNAEKLSFHDDSYDYILCKEAYHHFPRPYIAVYEMLRVSKRAIIMDRAYRYCTSNT